MATVAELVEQLLKMPQDSQVVIRTSETRDGQRHVEYWEFDRISGGTSDIPVTINGQKNQSTRGQTAKTS